jgi:HD-like signal output (HDOD) protein
VEDNPILLSLYATMLDEEPERWDVSTARDGERALELIEQGPYDVLVTDLGLPGVSGIELINQVRQRYPGCCRIILSGLKDQQVVARSLNATHQFLAKPFDISVLKATLDRVGSLDAFLADEALKSLVGQMGTLPSFPSLYLEIMKELGAEAPSVQWIAEIISQDPSMTAKLLQIANSAAMGLAHAVSSPFEAVQHLGFCTVRSLALTLHIFSPLGQTAIQGFSVDALWGHVVRTGALARRLGQLEGAEPAEAEDAYIAGMLHDAGKLMLAQSLPRKFQSALALAAARPCPLHEAEREVLGANHAGVAAYLLALWGLPANIVEAVAFHHAPAKGHADGFSALTAVHAANALEHEFFDDNPAVPKPELDLAYLSSLGVQERLPVWRANALTPA